MSVLSAQANIKYGVKTSFDTKKSLFLLCMYFCVCFTDVFYVYFYLFIALFDIKTTVLLLSYTKVILQLPIEINARFSCKSLT